MALKVDIFSSEFKLCKVYKVLALWLVKWEHDQLICRIFGTRLCIPWFVVDETDKILGRLPSTIANHIRGKNLASYMGAFVIMVNAEKIVVSGKKRNQKLDMRHCRTSWWYDYRTFDQLQQRIPKGRLGRALFNHLKVYKGPDHPQEAHKLLDLPIGTREYSCKNRNTMEHRPSSNVIITAKCRDFFLLMFL